MHDNVPDGVWPLSTVLACGANKRLSPRIGVVRDFVVVVLDLMPRDKELTRRCSLMLICPLRMRICVCLQVRVREPQ